MRLSRVFIGLVALVGCGGASGLDCSDCPDDELCWTTSDFDGSVTKGCMPWPEVCADEPTCDCVNDRSNNPTACDELGWQQNSDACSVIDGRPVLSCVSTLG